MPLGTGVVGFLHQGTQPVGERPSPVQGDRQQLDLYHESLMAGQEEGLCLLDHPEATGQLGCPRRLVVMDPSTGGTADFAGAAEATETRSFVADSLPEIVDTSNR